MLQNLIRGQIAGLNDARARWRLYASMATLLFAGSVMFGVVKARFSHKEPKLDFATADGKFYYLFISSAIVDGDLDFTNQLREQWPLERYALTPRGYVLDKYPIGLSLTLLPSFLPAHVLSRGMYAVTGSRFFVPNGYTALYQIFNLAWVFFLCWATFALLDRVMSHQLAARADVGAGAGVTVRAPSPAGVNGKYVAAGVLWAWLGTQYLYHAVRFPLMANVISTFWVTACIALCGEAIEAIRARREISWHWPAMAFCVVMAVITRPTNIVVVVFCGYALYVLVRQGLHGRMHLKRWVPWMILPALIPIALQMLVWHILFGRYITFSYSGPTFGAKGAEQFYWGDPVLFKSLFSLRAGLFLWCPVWAIGTIAVACYVLGGCNKIPGAWLIGCYLLAFVLLWYFNSAWWCWTFSCYPGRGYLEMVGLPAIGIALLFQQTESQAGLRRLLMVILIVALASTDVLEIGYDLSLVPRYADAVIDMGPTAARLER